MGRQAITLLLNDKPIRAAVTAASQKLQGIDGCNRAAELIENTIRNQQPVIATSSSPFACVRFIRNNGFDSGDVQ